MNSLLAIDIGAGSGAKIGVFDDRLQLRLEQLLPVSEFGGNFNSFVDRLIDMINTIAQKTGNPDGIGISSPGLFASDGRYLLCTNLPFLIGHNLAQRIEALSGIPTRIDNDANVGALAEWSVAQQELLYWVFGGGWGGAWVNRAGQIRFPVVNWDGNEASLHYSNEPGYAIHLPVKMLRGLLEPHGASIDGAEAVGTIRAGNILSGPGRERIYRACTGKTKSGEEISRLSQSGDADALRVDQLFGTILAEAANNLIQQARRDGLGDDVPIFIAGKPALALPYFGGAARERMRELGLRNSLQPSTIEQRGLKANLLGASLLAARAARAGLRG